jgi:catechol 2,3-dioxygenase-like lactoylglutathione lyase family enzyme
MELQMKIVKGYRHTGVICKNIRESLVFYRDYLGLKVIQDCWDNSEYMNEITGISAANVHMIKLEANDGTVVELLDYVTHPTEIIAQEIYNVGACHIAFQVYDIDYAYKALSEDGVKFLSEPVLSSEGIAKVCFCLDPNNVRIELVEMLT